MYIAFVERRRLTDEERTEASKHVDDNPEKGYVLWPTGFEQSNANTDPCDMWDGPCSCGAWHKAGQ